MNGLNNFKKKNVVNISHYYNAKHSGESISIVVIRYIAFYVYYSFYRQLIKKK